MSDATPIVRWEDPAAIGPGNQPGIAAGSRYRPAHTLSRVAALLVGLTSLLYLIDGLWSVYGVILLGDLEHVSNEQLTSYDTVSGYVGLASFGLYILAGIAVLAWVRRVVSNVPALTGDNAGHSPNMAVIWWFVPFANFVKPFQIVADVWRRLATTSAQERTGRVIGWWLGFALSNILATIYGRLPLPNSVEEFNSQANLNFASDVGLVLSGVLLIWIILEIEARSRARAAAVAQGIPIPAIQEVPAAAAAPTGPSDSPMDWWPSDDAPAPRVEPVEPAG